MMVWTIFPGYRPEVLGYIPGFLSEDDPRPAREQMSTNYMPGWQPMPGCTFNPRTGTMHYPGDPPFKPVAMSRLRNETIILFEHEFLMILQSDGSLEVARVD